METIRISDDDIKMILAPELERARAHQEDLSTAREEALRLYNMSKEADGIRQLNREGFSQSVSSVVWEAVEGLKVGLDSIFTNPDFFDVKTTGETERGDKLKQLIRYNMFIAQYGARELRTFTHQALIAPYSVLKIWWDEQYREEVHVVPVLSPAEAEALVEQGVVLARYDVIRASELVYGGDNGRALFPGAPVMRAEPPVLRYENVKIIRRVPVFSGPRLECVPPEDFFYSPGCKSLDEARLVAHRVRCTLADIQKGENEGMYRKGATARLAQTGAGAPEMRASETSERYTVDGMGAPDSLMSEGLGGSSGGDLARWSGPTREVEVWEVYTRLDIDGDGLLEPVIVFLAGDEVLQVIENPYKRPPFRVGRVLEVPFRFEGKSLPAILRQDMIELTQQYRLWNDSSADSVYGTVVTNDATLANEWPDRAIGDCILSGSFGQNSRFEVLRPGSPDGSILKAIEATEGRVERKSGVTRYNQGLDANSLNKTATGISLISSMSQQRQKFMAQVLGETLKDVVEDQIELFRMYGQEVLADLHKKGIAITPDDLRTEFTVEIEVGVGPQDRQAQAGTVREVIQMLLGGGIQAGLGGIEHVARGMDKVGNLLNVPLESLHYPVDMLTARSEQQLQAQQMVQQQALLQQQMQARQLAQQVAMQEQAAPQQAMQQRVMQQAQASQAAQGRVPGMPPTQGMPPVPGMQQTQGMPPAAQGPSPAELGQIEQAVQAGAQAMPPTAQLQGAGQ